MHHDFVNIIGFHNNIIIHFDKIFGISLIIIDHKPDIRTETNSQGSKILIIDGHRFHRYGGRKRKVSFMCHAYKTLG